MPDDRRSARRARLSGIRVAYESSTGEAQDAHVVDLSREGLFIAAEKPLVVGKRLSLEIQVAGEAATWPALGRVVWNRDVRAGDDLPAGMAVKFIDIDDSVAAAIDRLIEARERTEPGLGEGGAASANREEAPREPPRRERTMIGVGIAAPDAPVRAVAAAPAPVTPAASSREKPVELDEPVVVAVPSRERTMLGVGRGAVDTDSREASLAIDLVAKKPASSRPPPASNDPSTGPRTAPGPTGEGREPESPAEPMDRSVSEGPAPGRGAGRGWLLVLVLLLASGVASYACRERLLPFWHVAVATILRRLR